MHFLNLGVKGLRKRRNDFVLKIAGQSQLYVIQCDWPPELKLTETN